MTSRHRLLLASAGTGKTFRLTHHLIDLLASGEDPGRILASTFTRKAAGEILDRVLLRLVEGATDGEKLEDLNKHLLRNKLDAARCTELLAGLVRDLDRFQVRTLDAFFVHLGRLFAYDLGLPAGWTIADENQNHRLVEEATGRMLESVPTEELVELLRTIPREEAAKRSVSAAVRGAIKSARAPFLEATSDAWDQLSVPEGLGEDDLQGRLTFMRNMTVPLTGRGQPHSTWKKAKDKLLEALDADNWTGFLKHGLVQKVLEESPDYSRVAIDPDLADTIRGLTRQAAHVILADLARRNRATAALMTRFQTALDQVKQERGLLSFEDLPRALAPDGSRGPAALVERELDLDYRLDARLDHLLLDEFQDTAPVQWRLLERLVEEILSEQTGERSFFCVGDVKQSIYGWRAAEPRLLKGLEVWYQGLLARESLSNNYRSSEVILDTVNQVFSGVSGANAFSGDDNQPYREAAHTWQADFQKHISKKDMPGAALMIEAPGSEDGQEKWEPVIALTVERVLAIHREEPGASIGVLVRSNKPIPLLLEKLLARGLRASGEGGNPLTDSRAVLHFLSALHLADHPGDGAASFHVEASPLWGVLEGLSGKALTAPEQASAFLRARLCWEGLGEFASHFLAAVDRSEDYGDWDRRRFRQLVDLAYTHGASGLRLSSFVDLVRQVRIDDPAASGIKVMTVHSSKGLEFDAVVLPELDEQLKPRGGGVLTGRPDPRGRFEVCCNSPGGIAAKLEPNLKELYLEHKRRVMEEALCVLYVAMTRARQRLEMIVQQAKGTTLNYARILRDQLGVSEPDEAGVIWRQPDGSEKWFSPEKDEEAVAAPEAQPLVLRPSTSLRERPTRTPSGEEASGPPRAAALLGASPAGALTHGSLAHRWMEEIEWLEDFKIEEERLLSLGASIDPNPTTRRASLTAWREGLSKEEVRACLSRPASGGLFDEPEVWRERDFSVLLEEDGQETLWTGTFDRVVLFSDRAELIDFKTDAVEGESLLERVEVYRPQLEAYRRALAAITGLDLDAIEGSLLFLSPGRRILL